MYKNKVRQYVKLKYCAEKRPFFRKNGLKEKYYSTPLGAMNIIEPVYPD